MKFVLFLAAVFFVSSAGAQTSFYGRYEHLSRRGIEDSQIHVGLSQATQLGVFSGGLVFAELGTNGRSDARGFELSYGHSHSLGAITLSGQVGFERLNLVDSLGGGFSQHVSAYRWKMAAGVPIAPSVTWLIGLRHFNGRKDHFAGTGVFSGISYRLTGSDDIKASYRLVRRDGQFTNGVVLEITHRF